MFALIMPYIGNDDAIFEAEEVVIFHVGGDKEVSFEFNRFFHEKSAGATAQGNAAHGAVGVAAVAQGAHLEGVLHMLQELHGRGGRDVAYHAQSACALVAGLLWLRVEHLHIVEPQFLGNLEVHATLGTVHVGVGSIDGDVVLDGTGHDALDVAVAGNLLQAVENERVVRDDEVGTTPTWSQHP